MRLFWSIYDSEEDKLYAVYDNKTLGKIIHLSPTGVYYLLKKKGNSFTYKQFRVSRLECPKSNRGSVAGFDNLSKYRFSSQK